MNSIVFAALIILIIAPSIVFAEEPVPMPALVVQRNPYYFSEGDIGIDILNFFEMPMTPYLVPGKTTEQSSLPEISQAYNEESKQNVQVIVDESDRATAFVVEFSNGDIKEPMVFDTFTKFTHIAKNAKASSPYYYQSVRYGLELESLPSEDKKPFYDDLISLSINPGKKPEPFDVTVKILTGDGAVLQTWKYQKCSINSYTPFLDENVARIRLAGMFSSEIRDKTAFSCDGFGQDFVPQEPSRKLELPTTPSIPSKESRAERIIVQFSGGEFKTTGTSYSFSKFLPLVNDPALPIAIPGNVIGEKPRFLLDALPTKDKGDYYHQISRYINPGDEPEPFDVTIHIVSGANKTLQSWKYGDCSAYNYVTYFVDNILFYKIKKSLDSEIREKTFFECNGLEFNPDKISVDTNQSFVSDDSTRAQTFVVHFEGAEIGQEKTITSFTRFSPITHEELALLLPNAPFGDEPKFYLSSLPGKENQWFYQLVSRYINAGKIPDPFNVTVDVLLGDGTTIQVWRYADCQILEYKTFLDDSMLKRKFTTKSEPEIRDKSVFQCTGFLFDGTAREAEKTPEKPLTSVNFIPSEESRIKRVVTTFFGGEITEPFKIYTVGKFSPKIEQRSQTDAQLIRLSVALVPDEDSTVPESSSRDKPPTCEPGQTPPGCTPCPPNNPHCPENPPDGGSGGDCEGAECPESPDTGIPGITFPSNVLVTYPHLSVTQRNDYIKSTEFTITSLPSKDKTQIYGIISRYINPGSTPEPIDVMFDFESGDGTIVQSWKYAECQLKNFDVGLRDTLLYFPMGGTFGAADIVDSTTFGCAGFSVDFTQRKSEHDAVSTTPSRYDRAMFHLVHASGGELKSEKTSGLIQQFNTLGESSLFVGGLPNAQHNDVYEFVERYVNPGKAPEPTDIRVETFTGDGTVLYSTIYSDCTIKDAAINLMDSMLILKYTQSLKSEIRGHSAIDCTGKSFKVLGQVGTNSDHSSSLKKLSPLAQAAIGVESDKVVCSEGFDLMIRPPKNVAICVNADHTSKFVEKGWKIPTKNESKDLINVLRTPIPTEDERATSFTVTFEGTDISPPRIVETFSKFSPIADANSLSMMSQNPLDTPDKAFYLESLPSKDKSWYYELASRYVNPGAIPEPFNVSVQVETGHGDALQTWKYRECTIADFVTYYDDNLFRYKFHERWQSEFRDQSIFDCAGLLIDS